MGNALSKISMIAEAFFAGFYVSITRGLFIPMLAYSGYPVRDISLVLVPTAIGGILVSSIVYRDPRLFESRFKSVIISSHVLERLMWFSLPFLLLSPPILSLAYMLANVSAALTSILIGAAVYSMFSGDEVIEVSIHRSAASSLSSLLGSLVMTYVSAAYTAPSSYYLLYFTALLVGLSGSMLLMMTPIPRSISEPRSSVVEEVKIRSGTALIILSLMFAGSNMLGISWSPLLKELGAPVYITVALTITGNVGGILGSYVWRGYKAYIAAMLLNSLLTAAIPFIAVPIYHIAVSFLTSLTFLGVNLLGMHVFSEVNDRIGRIRASAYLVSSNYIGLLAASLISTSLQSPSQNLILAGSIKMLSTLIALITIQEAAIVPAKRAYEISKIIYSTSLLGYSFTLQASRELLKTFISALALTTLLLMLYILYRVALTLIGV
jgi:hypothetical protein